MSIFEILQPNYIYLIHNGEHIKENKAIYKIGKSKQLNLKRFKGYPNDSILLFQIICENCDDYETQLLRIFREKYIWEKKEGKEYFSLKSGQTKENMIDDIYKTVRYEKCKKSYTLYNFEKKNFTELKEPLSKLFPNNLNIIQKEKEISLESIQIFENLLREHFSFTLVFSLSDVFKICFTNQEVKQNENNKIINFSETKEQYIINILKKLSLFLYNFNIFQEITSGIPFFKDKYYVFRNLKIKQTRNEFEYKNKEKFLNFYKTLENFFYEFLYYFLIYKKVN